MKKNLFLTTIFVSFVSPVFVYADAISKFGAQITDINKTVVSAFATLFMALAMVAFFYGMVLFIWASREGESAGMKNGKQFMLWSVIGLFVMFSIYGLVKYGQRILGIDRDSTTIVIPSFQIGGSVPSASPDPLVPVGSGGPVGGSPTGGNNACAIDGVVDGDRCGTGKMCKSGECVPDFGAGGGSPTGGTGGNNACATDGVVDGDSCGTGKVCRSGSCVVSSTGGGVTGGTYGASCTTNSECSSGSGLTCLSSGLDTSTCRCPGNFVWSGGSCYDPATLTP